MTLYFKGVTEYLEELVTRIDTPRLDKFEITFFNQIDFDTPRLAQFINRSPTLRARDEAHVRFDYWTASVELRHRTSKYYPFDKDLQISISCEEPDWQLSSIEQVCNSSLRHLSTLEDLYIELEDPELVGLVWENDAIENNLWLQLLLPFTTVKDLYLSEEFAPVIAAALQELVGGRIAEVLPSLRNIFVDETESLGPVQENIGQFVAARQLSGHAISVYSSWSGHSDWKMQLVNN
jgi:hypothetical protein